MIIQLLIVLVAIIVGARMGGIGLGVMGGIGLMILTFVFGLQPTAPPMDVMLMIAAVIAAASCMQAAGGLDYLVKQAERILRDYQEISDWCFRLLNADLLKMFIELQWNKMTVDKKLERLNLNKEKNDDTN